MAITNQELREEISGLLAEVGETLLDKQIKTLLTKDIYQRDLTKEELTLVRDNTARIVKNINLSVAGWAEETPWYGAPVSSIQMAAGLVEARYTALINHGIEIDVPRDIIPEKIIDRLHATQSPEEKKLRYGKSTAIGLAASVPISFLLPAAISMGGPAMATSTSTVIAAITTGIGLALGFTFEVARDHEEAKAFAEDGLKNQATLSKQKSLFMGLKQYLAETDSLSASHHPDPIEDELLHKFRKLEQSNPELAAKVDKEIAAKRNTPVPAATAGATAHDAVQELTPTQMGRLAELAAEVGTTLSVAGKPSGTRIRVETPEGEKDWRAEVEAQQAEAEAVPDSQRRV